MYFVFIYLLIFTLIPISNINLEKRTHFNALAIRLAPAQLYREGGTEKKKKEKKLRRKINIYTSSFWGMLVIQSQWKAEMQTAKTTLPSFKFNLSINMLVFDFFLVYIF